MFAVIQNDQRLFFLQICFQKFERVLARLILDTHCRKDSLWNQVWVCKRCEFHEPDAMIELLDQFCCHLKRETRLARAA